jgi:hypothetical protein
MEYPHGTLIPGYSQGTPGVPQGYSGVDEGYSRLTRGDVKYAPAYYGGRGVLYGVMYGVL